MNWRFIKTDINIVIVSLRYAYFVAQNMNLEINVWNLFEKLVKK